MGITLVGVLAGAFGGATIAEEIAAGLQSFPWLARYGEAIGIGTVVLGITFCSLILGELVPKRIGLNNPERIARLMAGPMNRLAWLASPLVRLLSASTDLVLRLIRLKKPSDPPVTEEEVKVMIQEGVQAGVFDRREPEMVEGVLSLDRLPVRDIMTPRAKIIWINQADPHEAIWHKIVVSGHSHYPVYEHSRDQVVGVVSLKAIYANLAAGIPANVSDLLVPPLFIAGSQTAASLLETFKRTGQHVALVTDDAGRIIGLVTADRRDGSDRRRVSFARRAAQARRPRSAATAPGWWTASCRWRRWSPCWRGCGSRRRTNATTPPSVSLWPLRIGRAPKEGETFDEQGCRFEILDLDGARVDKVLITPLDSGSPLLKPVSHATSP